MDAQEKNELGWSALRACAPFFLAWVAMVVFRVGFASGMHLSFTLFLAVYAVVIYIRSPFNRWLLVGLLLSSIITMIILGVGAARAEIEPGSSLREIGTDYQWATLVNACVFGLAALVDIWRKRCQLSAEEIAAIEEAMNNEDDSAGPFDRFTPA